MYAPKPRMPATTAGMMRGQRRPSMYDPPPPRPSNPAPAPSMRPQANRGMPSGSGDAGSRFSPGAGVAPPPKPTGSARPQTPPPGGLVATFNPPTLGGGGPQYPAAYQGGPAPRPVGNDTPVGPPTGIRPAVPEGVQYDNASSAWRSGEGPHTRETYEASIPEYMAGGGWMGTKPVSGLFEDEPYTPGGFGSRRRQNPKGDRGPGFVDTANADDDFASTAARADRMAQRTRMGGGRNDDQRETANVGRSRGAQTPEPSEVPMGTRPLTGGAGPSTGQAPGAASAGYSGIGSGVSPLEAGEVGVQSSALTAEEAAAQAAREAEEAAAAAADPEAADRALREAEEEAYQHAASGRGLRGAPGVDGVAGETDEERNANAQRQIAEWYTNDTNTRNTRAYLSAHGVGEEDIDRLLTLFRTGDYWLDQDGSIHRTSDLDSTYEEGDINKEFLGADEDLSARLGGALNTPGGKDISKTRLEESSENDPSKKIADALNTPPPEFDKKGLEDLLRAQRQRQAFNLAMATRRAMQGASNAGSSAEAQMGFNADLSQQSGLAGAEQEAQTRLTLEQQHDQRVFQWAQQQRALATQAGLAEQAHRFALIEQEAAGRIQRRNAAASQPSFGQQLGRGLLTAGLGMVPFVGSGLASAAGSLWDAGTGGPSGGAGYDYYQGYGGPMRSWSQGY